MPSFLKSSLIYEVISDNVHKLEFQNSWFHDDFSLTFKDIFTRTGVVTLLEGSLS